MQPHVTAQGLTATRGMAILPIAVPFGALLPRLRCGSTKSYASWFGVQAPVLQKTKQKNSTSTTYGKSDSKQSKNKQGGKHSAWIGNLVI